MGSIPEWMQIILFGLLIVAIGELVSQLLRYLPRSASRTISARLGRARAGAAKLGVRTGKGDLRGQFDELKRRKLGFVGWLRYVRARKRLLGPTPESVLQSHSRRSYLRDTIYQFLLRCISLFRPYGIISAANLRILLLAGAIVVVIKGQEDSVKTTLIHLRETIPWHSIAEWLREWYVLVALVVVALIVARRSPLVDRIRARDEAAKDANRLLAQLYGRLSDLQLCAAEYIKLIDESRAEVVDGAVLKASSGLYTWTHSGGLTPNTNRFMVNTPGGWPSKKADRLEQACKELSDHLAGYRRNGLHTVARRLMLPVFFSLFECCISFSDPELFIHLRTRLLVDFVGDANTRIQNDFKMMTQAEGHDEHESREFLRIHTDDAIRDYAGSLDMRLASAYVTLLHLNHINYFLNRRLHGNTRTRLAGSFVR
jgi:hypothetical protein